MKRLFIELLFCFFTTFSFAQVSVQATATATIVSPVGITPLSKPLNSLPLSSFSSATKGGAKAVAFNQPLLTVANFQLWGSVNNLYQFTVASSAVWLVNPKSGSRFLLNHLQIAAADTQTPQSFALYGQPMLPKQLLAGTYSSKTPVEITVHFN